MVRASKGSLKSSTGHDLITVQFLPDDAPKAVLCFHHGLQEHIGRYQNIFTTMADNGIAVFSLDAVGHGESGGDRALISKFDNIIDDFEAVINAAAANPDIAAPNGSLPPFFIGGHSLGGLIAATTLLRDQARFKGLLMSDPAVDVEWTPVLRVQAFIGNLLAAVVPKARVVPAVAPEKMNRDPEKVKEYVEDPLNTVGPVAAVTANESLKAFRQLAKKRAEVVVPIYAHHGTEDKVTSFSATKTFVDGASSTDKTFLPVEGGYHEVMFESCGPELVQGMIDWILKRAGTSAEAKM